MMKPHIVILFAGRFMSEKAAGLFVDLNARSLADKGVRVTVVAPRRFGRLPVGDAPYAVSLLPTIDLSRIPGIARYANYVSVAVFSFFASVWLMVRTHRDDIVISNDALPLVLATFVRARTLYEMHDFVQPTFLYRMLLARTRWILVTNEWKRDELVQRHAVAPEKIILERNAVDTAAFGATDRDSARDALAIPRDARIAVYTGHLYEWKGADTLAAAAAHIPDTHIYFVGGTEADVARFRAQWGGSPNIRIVGHVEHERIPLWQSAADVLVLPNSAKEEISVHYTSPMKLFEYMASERPIVASDLPSIREVLPGSVGYFATPDDAKSLADEIRHACTDPQAGQRAATGRSMCLIYSWESRAARILHLIV